MGNGIAKETVDQRSKQKLLRQKEKHTKTCLNIELDGIMGEENHNCDLSRKEL